MRNQLWIFHPHRSDQRQRSAAGRSDVVANCHHRSVCKLHAVVFLADGDANIKVSVAQQLDGPLLLSQHQQKIFGKVFHLIIRQEVGHSAGAELSVVDLFAQRVDCSQQAGEHLGVIPYRKCQRIDVGRRDFVDALPCQSCIGKVGEELADILCDLKIHPAHSALDRTVGGDHHDDDGSFGGGNQLDVPN